jgi:beta-glucuronidase
VCVPQPPTHHIIIPYRNHNQPEQDLLCWHRLVVMPPPPRLHGGTAALPFWPHYPLRRVQVLDGRWRFGFQQYISDVMALSFADLDASMLTPANATVPSSFDVGPPGAVGRRGTAFYRRRIRTRRNAFYQLQFMGCSFYCRVWVDGVLIGEHHEGGYQPFWLAVPMSPLTRRDLLVLADNRFNSSTAPLHTRGDYYQFGGLTRSVLLHEVATNQMNNNFEKQQQLLPRAPLAMRRVEVTPCVTLDAVNVSVVFARPSSPGVPTGPRERHHQSVSMSFSFDGERPTGAPISLHLQPVPYETGSGFVIMAAHVDGLQVPKPRVWSTQEPNLHTLTVWRAARTTGAARHAAGNQTTDTSAFLDAIRVRFGLRVLDIGSKGEMLLNRQPFRLRGVNRHTMWPDTGSSLTSEQLARDLELLRLLGANYVRGAHYPQDQRFLDACDEAGIMVWEETQGSGVYLRHLKSVGFMRHQLRALHAMVSASFNHPAVIIHGFFNEGPSKASAACEGYRAVSEAVRTRVPRSHRLVGWASSAKSEDLCLAHTDLLAWNDYPGWYVWSGLSPVTAWRKHAMWAGAHHPSKPFIICETGAGALYEWPDGRYFPRQLLPATYVADGVFRRRVKRSSETIAGLPKGMWSQTYQAKLLTDVVSEAFSSARISGFSLWQLTDIKADDDHIRACGACTLDDTAAAAASAKAGSDQAKTAPPQDCATYTSACGFPFATSRPAGLNHKGLVDYWRRPKASFWALSRMFEAERRREQRRAYWRSWWRG